MNKGKMVAKMLMPIIVVITIIVSAMPVKAQLLLTLTKEEQEYISKKNIVEAVSLNGLAPLQYYDANGQVKGISKEVLEENDWTNFHVSTVQHHR